MIDVGLYLRQAYFTTLNGNVIYAAQPVPIVDEKLDIDINETDIYVLMTSQDENAEGIGNKTQFVNETLIRMQIVNQRSATNTKEVVEEVAGQILNVLFPSRTVWNVSLADPLNLTYARYVSGQYNPLVQTENGFAISKVLTFKNRITQ